MRKEHFWNYSDLEQLYKNVKEIFVFQTKFLRILEESLESDPGFGSHSSLVQFKVIALQVLFDFQSEIFNLNLIFQSLLMAIGTAFLYNVDEFKIYSTYCANHSKAQKALHQSKSSNYGKRVCIEHTSASLKIVGDKFSIHPLADVWYCVLVVKNLVLFILNVVAYILEWAT